MPLRHAFFCAAAVPVSDKQAYSIEMISDFHNDLLTKEGSSAQAFGGSVVSGVCALFRGERRFADVAALAEGFCAAHPTNVYLGLEDIGYFTEEYAARICGWRPVYASLTWNGENALAGGCMSEARLTERGRAAVRALCAEKIYIDVSHLNAASFCDVLDCSPFGIVASHSCFYTLKKHPRNLYDWQAREIVARGGLIGVTFVGAFLTSGRARADDAFRHLEYGAEKFGIGSVCIGSDFNGTDDLPQGLRTYAEAETLRNDFVRAGYAAEEIDKIFVKNLQEFLQKTGGSAPKPGS